MILLDTDLRMMIEAHHNEILRLIESAQICAKEGDDGSIPDLLGEIEGHACVLYKAAVEPLSTKADRKAERDAIKISRMLGNDTRKVTRVA